MHLLDEQKIGRTLVFTRTKHGADRVTRDLKKLNVQAAAIHGDKSQLARQHALSQFKNGRLKVLVATDIAARGIDVDALTHVINYDLPEVPETYVHRIGRTGRAGASGIALSFCDGGELDSLKDINKLIGQKIPAQPHPFESQLVEVKKEVRGPRNNGNRSDGQQRHKSRTFSKKS